MTIRTNKYPVQRLIPVQNVLVSVFDKTDVGILAREILNRNAFAKFYSTGGTAKELKEHIPPENFCSIEDFTGCPEMEGGLVKTLHPKVHAGLLAERGNPAHQKYLSEDLRNMGKGPGVYFDLAVVNLYPFSSVVQKEGNTSEDARVNIDIGGPTMVMASAKNWHSVAVLTNPAQYNMFSGFMADNKGSTTAKQRFDLAKQAMRCVGDYRTNIADHFENLNYATDIAPYINMEEEK